MSTWRWFAVCGCITLFLTGCKALIYDQVKESIVLIYYQDKKGQGTGFFVEGNKEGCNVLTARHVVPVKTKIKLKTSDEKIWEVSDIQRFPDHDLAVINFKVDNKNECPYTALNLGDSDSIKVSDDVYIAGFPGNDSVPQFTSGKVSYIGGNIDGYGISYTVITAGGMSGGPVINTSGKVIAVHGRADVELVKNAQQKEKESTINTLKTFKWGIPINAYPENVDKVPTKEQQEKQAKYFYNQGNDLLVSKRYEEALECFDKAVASESDYHEAWYKRGIALYGLKRYQEEIESYDKAVAIKSNYYQAWYAQGYTLQYKLKRYKEAIESYDKAIAGKLNYHQAWNSRGIALYDLKRYQEALESYDAAIAFKPDYHQAWYNRGISLGELKRYQEAIESYDKAIAIKPDFYLAWNNRGFVLKNLKRHEKAIESYDKAIAIKPDLGPAWNNRGFSLNELKRYEEAIESLDKAIAIKPDIANPWNHRGYALENLKRYQEALESYDKAIKFNPNYETAINNRKRLLKKLNQ